MEEKTSMSRRTFFGSVAATGAAVAAGQSIIVPVLAMADDGTAKVKDPHGFLVFPKKCVSCGKCVKACRSANRTPEEYSARRRLTKYVDEDGNRVTVSTACMHCADPACVKVCPAKAITQDENGIVSVNPEKCIGCKYCYQACPFKVPRYTATSMDKCDYCKANGSATPRCAEACPTGALRAGTMSELLALAGDGAKQLDLDCKPSFYLA